MKNIYKKVLQLMDLGYFKSYKILIQDDLIDIRLMPKNDRGYAVCYYYKNTKHNIEFIGHSLGNDIKKIKSGNY